MKQPNSHITQSNNRNVSIEGDNYGIIVTGDGNTIYFSPQRTVQMRAPVNDFVGRENEIADLLKAIRNGSGAAICGIKGMGGVGKTELALKVAHELKKDFPAQLRVDLQGTSNHPTSPETALGFVIRAFYKDEIKLPNSQEELTQLYLQTLGDKPVLLLLDNAHRPEQVRPFLPPSNCALLITSRHPIKLPGLTHLDLETLPPDKARELFNAIKSGVAPDIADEICNLCGYLPLAIRAAATLLDVEIDLDAADYLNELRDEQKRLKEIERVNDEDRKSVV